MREYVEGDDLADLNSENWEENVLSELGRSERRVVMRNVIHRIRNP